MADKILDEYITVYLSITGWTVVHRVLVDEGDGNPYWDNQQTGIGKYKTREEALIEAKTWGETEEIKVIE